MSGNAELIIAAQATRDALRKAGHKADANYIDFLLKQALSTKVLEVSILGAAVMEGKAALRDGTDR